MKQPLLPGAKWRQTHQVTVNSVLGSDPNSPKFRKVRSRGREFLNRDTWYARTFAGVMCEWARLNKDVQPTQFDVRRWLQKTTESYYYSTPIPEIIIAQTPDELPVGLAMALVGGAYHEAWHTEYSRRTPLTLDEVQGRVLELWGLIPWAPEKGFRGWSKLTGQVLEWSNIIEDIRIERLGCQEFPGSPEKMEALQDLILEMEGPPNEDLVSICKKAFRDLGLGYETGLQVQRLQQYREVSEEAWALVHSGKLRPLLDRAVKLTKKDDLESLWLAMEVVAALAGLIAPLEAAKWAQENPPPPPPPKEVDQADATPEEPGKVPPESAQEITSKKPPLYKVGDVIRIKSGPLEGAKAKVTRADLPDFATGVQAIGFELIG